MLSPMCLLCASILGDNLLSIPLNILVKKQAPWKWYNMCSICGSGYKFFNSGLVEGTVVNNHSPLKLLLMDDEC